MFKNNTTRDQEKWYYHFIGLMTKSFLMFLCSVFMWKMKYTKRGRPCFKEFMSYCWEASHNVKGLWPRQLREGRTEECSEMVSEHPRPQSPSSLRAVILALSSEAPGANAAGSMLPNLRWSSALPMSLFSWPPLVSSSWQPSWTSLWRKTDSSKILPNSGHPEVTSSLFLKSIYNFLWNKLICIISLLLRMLASFFGSPQFF